MIPTTKRKRNQTRSRDPGGAVDGQKQKLVFLKIYKVNPFIRGLIGRGHSFWWGGIYLTGIKRIKGERG